MTDEVEARRFWNGGVVEGDEVAKQHGVELEPEGAFPQQRFVAFRRIVNPQPAPVPSLEEQLDAQVVDAEKLADQREAASQSANERLAQAEEARVSAPNEPGTLVELEAAERAAHVAALDLGAARKARDRERARVSKMKASGQLAELQAFDAKQTDGAVLALVEPFQQQAASAGTMLGEAVALGVEALNDMMASRRRAESLARHLEIHGWRPGRLDRAILIAKLGTAFAAAFATASKLPRSAVSRWTGA